MTQISLVIWLINPTVPAAPLNRKLRAGPFVCTSAGSSGPSASSIRCRISAAEMNIFRIWAPLSIPVCCEVSNTRNVERKLSVFAPA